MARANTSTTKKLLIAVNILVILGLAGATTYLFIDNRDLNDQLTLTNEEKNERLVSEVSRVFQLPDDETPEVIYVKDGEKAAEENPAIVSVFEDLRTDDYILLYKKARLGVQYRPSEKKVVHSSDISIPVAVELIGSEESIENAEKELSKFGNQLTITKTVNDDVTQSFVVGVNDKLTSEVNSIAEELGLDLGSTLPSSITPKDQTEVVIVVVEGAAKPAAEPESTQEP